MTAPEGLADEYDADGLPDGALTTADLTGLHVDGRWDIEDLAGLLMESGEAWQIYTQVDTDSGGVAYLKGWHVVNRTGVYAFVPIPREPADKRLADDLRFYNAFDRTGEWPSSDDELTVKEVIRSAAGVLDRAELYTLFEWPLLGTDGKWYNVVFEGELVQVDPPVCDECGKEIVPCADDECPEREHGEHHKEG